MSARPRPHPYAPCPAMSGIERSPDDRPMPGVVLHVEEEPNGKGFFLCVEDGDGTTSRERLALTDEHHRQFDALRDWPDDDNTEGAQRTFLDLLGSVPTATARLRRYVPASPDDLPPLERVFFASTSAVAHRLPIELITFEKRGRDTDHVAPALTDRSNLVRSAQVATPSPEPPDRTPRVLVVLGRQGQSRAARDGRPLVLDLLHAIVGAGRGQGEHKAELHFALPKQEHEVLAQHAGRDRDLTAVAQLLADPARRVVLRSVETLLALLRGDALALDGEAAPRGPYDVVFFLGHSFEENVTRAHGVAREAAAFDLGLPRDGKEPRPTFAELRAALAHGATRLVAREGKEPGPTFDELRDALVHGESRLVGMFACLVGPDAALALLQSVDHVLLTSARVRVDDASGSLRALLQALLLERRNIDVVARRARGAFPPGRAWILQQWTRTRSLRVLADPVALALADYRRKAAVKTRDDLLGTLLEDLALRVEEAIAIAPDGADGSAKVEYARVRRRERRRPEDGVFAGGATLADKLAAYRDTGEPCLEAFVVLAPPGAGKTVLLQGERARLAQEPDAFWIPVLVRLREWVRDDPTGDVLRFAVARMRGVAPAAVGDDDRTLRALRDAQHHRRVAFLLDGLDEVSPAAHDSLFPRLRELAAVPGCPVVVTSRPIGFINPGGLAELWLQPLDEPRQRDLVAKRYPERDDLWSTLARRCDASPSLQHLAGNPLFLTLMADLAAGGTEIQARPFLVLQDVLAYLLHQRHRPENQRMPYEAPEAVFAVLRRLALWWTRRRQAEWSEADLRAWITDDRDAGAADPVAKRLEADLRARGDWNEAAGFAEWLAELGRRTGIVNVGGEMGRRTFEFRHRAFQELLCAERLHELSPGLADPVQALAAGLGAGEVDGAATNELVNYWAEPIALAAGEITDPGAWILALIDHERTKPIALRALANACQLEPDTVTKIVGKLREWSERVAVYEALVERVDHARVVALLDALRRARTDGNDLWHLREVTLRLAAAGVAKARELANCLFDHLPPPRARDFARILPTRVPGIELRRWLGLWWRGVGRRRRPFLWKAVPAGTFTMGSPDNEEGRSGNENQVEVSIAQPFWIMATPVTFAMYRAFDRSHRHEWGEAPDLPVTEVAGLPRTRSAPG